VQGAICQRIDTDNLLAKNWEAGWPFNQVYAELLPYSDVGTAVNFRQFRIGGLIPVNVDRVDDGGGDPSKRARGKIEVTYVDEELRISRGDRGNLFVLVQEDPSARIERKGW